MDPHGKNQRHYVRGLRNAVGLRWIDGRLHATNMGADHLGINRPADVFTTVRANANYGWPYCYQAGTRIYSDPKFNQNGKFDCKTVPLAQTPFAAHSSPLGFAYFDQGSGELLKNAYLVALHGSTRKSLARGYRVVRVRHDFPLIVDDFITGFMEGITIHGRPADVFRFGDGFLLSDDRAGVIYYVYRK
jgi:glucose/arabinose dehydrogenase